LQTFEEHVESLVLEEKVPLTLPENELLYCRFFIYWQIIFRPLKKASFFVLRVRSGLQPAPIAHGKEVFRRQKGE
jgi:hypothetical protein